MGKIRIRMEKFRSGTQTQHKQRCGFGIRCLFDPWIRDPGGIKKQDPDPGWTTRIKFPRALKPFFEIKYLKVSKCEIFDRSDFHDFLHQNVSTGGRLWVNFFKYIFRGPFGTAEFLTRILSLILRSAVPSKHAEHTHQELMRTGTWAYGSRTDAFAENTHQ